MMGGRPRAAPPESDRCPDKARHRRAFVVQRRRAAADEGNVIRLHKLGHTPQPFHLNPDLVLTIEANPDTVVTLTTGTRYLVMETPDQVADATRAWRASVLDAMNRVPRRSHGANPLSLVRGTAGDGAAASLAAEQARLDAEKPNLRDHRP